MTKDFYGIVYSITNSVNGKMYIGQTIQPLKNRMHQHLYKARKGKMLPLYSSIRKYGWDNFKCEIIGYAKSKEELDDMEIKHIKINDSTSIGYNIAHGGGGTVGAGRTLSVDEVICAKEIIRDTYLTFQEMENLLDININTLFSIYYGTSWSHVNVEGFHKNMERLKKPKIKKEEKDRLINKKLTDDRVRAIKIDMINGLSNKDICDKYNLSKYTISKISRGKTYTDVYVEGFTPSNKSNSKGTKNGMAKLSLEDVLEIKRLISKGKSNRHISEIFGVAPNTISRIKTGARWGHVSAPEKEGGCSDKSE